MRVIVCGGRNYKDKRFVWWMLDKLNARKPITMIIHGCARGADSYAEEWAALFPGQCTAYGIPAEWKKHGDRAGPIRNRLMLDLGQPDLVVAFQGGTGTANMTAAATAAGVKVLFAEKLRHHFAPQEDVGKRIGMIAKVERRERHDQGFAPRTTGGAFVASCQCEVLPWQPCEHTAV